MARIRTIKPEFFRHEGLQDLEAQHPGKHIMLVYAALWTQCDSKGTFPWKPRTLALDVLPFLDYSLAATLDILAENAFIERCNGPDGAEYGHVPTFLTHQRITGQEFAGGQKYPDFSRGKHSSASRETLEKHSSAQEGKGREREREGERERERERESPPENDSNQNQNRKQNPSRVALRASTLPEAITILRDWQATEIGAAQVEALRQAATYSPEKYRGGGIAEQAAAFVAYYWKTPGGQIQIKQDVVAYADSTFCSWLINAKSMNRPADAARSAPTQAIYSPPPIRAVAAEGQLPAEVVEKMITTYAGAEASLFSAEHRAAIRAKSPRPAIDLILAIAKTIRAPEAVTRTITLPSLRAV